MNNDVILSSRTTLLLLVDEWWMHSAISCLFSFSFLFVRCVFYSHRWTTCSCFIRMPTLFVLLSSRRTIIGDTRWRTASTRTADKQSTNRVVQEKKWNQEKNSLSNRLCKNRKGSNNEHRLRITSQYSKHMSTFIEHSFLGWHACLHVEQDRKSLFIDRFINKNEYVSLVALDARNRDDDKSYEQIVDKRYRLIIGQDNVQYVVVMLVSLGHV
jgi:hypothetical protein